MYANHFGLRSDAFSLTPDPAFLYLSPDHAEALAGLKIGLADRRGLMVMVAEVGMGKTTLLYSLLSEIGAGMHAAYISNTRLAFDDLLRQALADFGVSCDGRDRLALLGALNGFLRQCAAEGSTAALVIDEAQNLDDDAFENLRLLSNFETYDTKLLQIVLVGQPELEAKLRQPHLRQVTERVAVRCYVNPLSREESARYVEHRLRCAGGSSSLFTPPALRLVLRRAQGIPRRINILCHNALLFAYGRGEHRVSRSVVRAAVREKEGRGLVTLRRRWRSRLALWAAASAAPRSRLRPWWAGAGFVAGIIASLTWGEWLFPMHAPDTTRVMNEPGVYSDETQQAARPLGDRQDGALGALAPASVAAVPPEVVVPSLLSATEAGATSEPASPPDLRATTEEPSGTAGAPSASATRSRDGERPSFREVVVPPGTTLRGLAHEIYGDASQELIHRIKAANPKIVDANHIFAGDRLRFPEVGTGGPGTQDAREAVSKDARHE